MLLKPLFTMQRGLATRKLSVRPSVCQMRDFCDKTKESCAHIFIPHQKTFILFLETRRMVDWGDPFYLKF